jgi:hypothetical protein
MTMDLNFRSDNESPAAPAIIEALLEANHGTAWAYAEDQWSERPDAAFSELFSTNFGGALNLNIHFHMLFLDGVYIDSTDRSRARFRWIKAPTSDELTQLTHTIAQWVGRYLERQLGSHCMQVSLPELINGRNWNVCAGTSQDRRYPLNAYH